jgi:hypothetical protein
MAERSGVTSLVVMKQGEEGIQNHAHLQMESEKKSPDLLSAAFVVLALSQRMVRDARLGSLRRN